MDADAHSLQCSRADVWYLKSITFGEEHSKRSVKIITQNFNGPCSFIAICNILILRGNINILPQERTTVSYEFLSQLVGEYLLSSSPDVDVSAALSIMPVTQKGMDLNPVFTAATSFRPAGAGGELQLFEQVGIKLVHGWVVDPDSDEAHAVHKTADYDSAVNLIAEADHTTNGHLVVSEDPFGAASSAPNGHVPKSLTEEEREKVTRAITVNTFLYDTQSQLTYHGLFTLASILQPGQLVALFRSSHLSVLYKSTGPNPSLYTLVSDHVFLHEPDVVWERLEDIDGGWSTFVDSNFVKSTPVGGDFAGQTAEATLRAMEARGSSSGGEQSDQVLARQLQAEEDELARRAYARWERERHDARRRQDAANLNAAAAAAASMGYNMPRHPDHARYPDQRKKPKQCIIM